VARLLEEQSSLPALSSDLDVPTVLSLELCSSAFLNARAHLILRQRLIEAEEARMAKQVRTLRRTKRKLQRAK